MSGTGIQHLRRAESHRYVYCVQFIHPERIFAGGTAWRVTGLDTDGNVAMVGVEAFRDNLGRRVLLVTIMDGGR
jgi:hypothetical protein